MILRQRIRFYQQMASLVRAGVPMRTTLSRLQEKIDHPQIRTLARVVGAGEPIGTAFAEADFSSFETHLVEAGERSGQLETIFSHLATFWERERQMIDTLVSQLAYPIVVFHLGLLVNFLPILLFQSLDSFIKALIFWLCFLYGIAFGGYFIVRETWRSPVGQRFWLLWPVLGRAISASYAYRWITALRLEFGAGIPLPEAVADAWRATGFAQRQVRATTAEAALREGTELSVLMRPWRELPEDWLDFVESGEIAGDLDKTFKTLENEAAYTWALAQQRLRDWLPKALYFFILIIVAFQIYQATQAFSEKSTGELDEINKIIDEQH